MTRRSFIRFACKPRYSGLFWIPLRASNVVSSHMTMLADLSSKLEANFQLILERSIFSLRIM